MKEKKEKKSENKIIVNTGKATRAYNLLTAQKTDKGEGFKLPSEMETADIFRVLRATNAIRPVATAMTDFQTDAQKRLQPDNWEELTQKLQRFSELSKEEKAEVNRDVADYNRRIDECISTEVAKDREIDAYEKLSEEAFATLIKANGHLLNLGDIVLLEEILCK